MGEMPQSIVAGFEARKSAEEAADELLKKGFAEDDVIVAVRDHDYASSGGAMVRSEDEDAISHLAHLIGLSGFPEDESRGLATRFDSMDAIVAVDTDERHDVARSVLSDHGGNFDGSTETLRPSWEEARHVLRGHWERKGNHTGKSWDEASSGYEYVYEKAVEPEFRGRTWQSAEPELQSGYQRWLAERGYRQPSSSWDWLKETMHELWTNATRGASPDDIVHPERLHRWIRLQRSVPVAEKASNGLDRG